MHMEQGQLVSIEPHSHGLGSRRCVPGSPNHSSMSLFLSVHFAGFPFIVEAPSLRLLSDPREPMFGSGENSKRHRRESDTKVLVFLF